MANNTAIFFWLHHVLRDSTYCTFSSIIGPSRRFDFMIASMIALDHANTPFVIRFLSGVHVAKRGVVSCVRLVYDTGVVYKRHRCRI